jgi:hypothetical protein
MDRFARSSLRTLLLAAAAAAFLSLISIPSQAQPDPPAQAGRISYISGNVSIQPDDSDDWGQAYPNLPLGPGDRIFTDFDGRAEIQIGQTFVRIGPNSDFTLVDSTDDGLYFGVAQGSIHVRTNGLWDDQSVFVNTPSGSSALADPGEWRVDVIPGENASVFTTFGDTDLFLTGAGGYAQYIGGGQALELVGSNPVYPQWLQAAEWDDLDNWSHRRDQQIAQAVSYQYVSREIPGAYELDANGTWMPGTPYGAIWFPNNVEAGWAPYHNGHWVNHAPWGWVWVEDENWGYAPFHYGRWVSYNGRWGWVAGPLAAHPVWSPALVVFAGGIHVGGVSVSAWFPLGPGEAYHPWYHTSPEYVNRVNITNIVEAPRVHVQTTYVNVTNVTNITYINRTSVVVVRNEDFAAGRPVQKTSVAVDAHVMDHVQVIERPEPQPVKVTVNLHPPTRPVPVAAARPVLINSKGMAVAAKPNAQPVAPPVKTAPPVIKALPGHTVVAPPPNAGKALPPGKTAPGSGKIPAVAPVTPMPVTKPVPQPAVKPVPVSPPATKTAAPPTPPAVPAPVTKPVPQPVVKPTPAPPPTPKTTASPANNQAVPVVPKPAEKPAPQPPAKATTPPPANTPPPTAAKPAPTPAAKTPPPTAAKPAPEPTVKTPPTPPAAKPNTPPGPPPNAAKPGTPPPANDKNKKDEKDKDKEKDKEVKPQA